MEELLAVLAVSLTILAILGVPLLALVLGALGVGWAFSLQRQLTKVEERLATLAAPRVEGEPDPVDVQIPTDEFPPVLAATEEARLVVEDLDEQTEVVALPVSPEAETVYGTVDPALLAAMESGELPPPPPEPEATEPVPARPSWRIERVLVWVASILGGFLVLLAALFALVVTLERGWLGPPVRISLGLMAGTALWTLGSLARGRHYRLLVSALYGAGLGTLYGTLFAAAGMYHLMGHGTAFALMTAVTAVAMAVAVRHSDRFMAHLGLVGGLLTPILVSTGENNPGGLFTYLALLATGALVGSARRRWWDVAAVTVLGSAALYLAWTVAWYQADQAPAGLMAALALCVVFALVAVGARRSTAVAGVALGGAALLPVLALGWLLPVDAVFWDPHSYVEVARPLGHAPWWAAAGVVLLAGPAWLASRVRGWWPATLAATLVASLLVWVLAAAWVDHPAPPVWALVVGIVGPLAAALAATLGGRRASWGLLPLPLASGVALALVLGLAEPAGLAVLVSTSALVVLGALLAATTRQPWLLLATLGGSALALTAAAWGVEDLGVRWVAGPTVLAYALLATLPLLSRDRRLAAVLTAALAGPALFLPLYWCWELALDGVFVGALPVFLGAVALLGAVVLVRRFGAGRRDGGLALFVGVALAGITTALPLQLDDQWLTVAWALEGAALGWLSRRLTHPLVRWVAVLLCVTVAVRLLVNPWALSYGDASGWPLLNWTLYTWGIPAIALLLAGPALRRPLPDPPSVLHRLDALVPATLTVLGILVGFALVHVQVSHLFQDAGPLELGGHGILQGMVRSLAWAAYGVVALVAGLVARRRSVRLVGFALVLLATAKVFAVDLWALSGFVRVGSVLGLGVSLLLAAFLFERLVLRSTSAEDA